MAAKRVRVLVSGEVQGVGFRWYCREQAIQRNLGGSVKNLPDGRVEAYFEGEEDSVQELIEWCRTGPRSARVSSVDLQEEEPTGQDRFSIER